MGVHTALQALPLVRYNSDEATPMIRVTLCLRRPLRLCALLVLASCITTSWAAFPSMSPTPSISATVSPSIPPSPSVTSTASYCPSCSPFLNVTIADSMCDVKGHCGLPQCALEVDISYAYMDNVNLPGDHVWTNVLASQDCVTWWHTGTSRDLFESASGHVNVSDGCYGSGDQPIVVLTCVSQDQV